MMSCYVTNDKQGDIMRIDNEIKLDYKDVLIRPKRSILKSRGEVNLTRSFTFRNSGNLGTVYQLWLLIWMELEHLVLLRL